MSHPSPPEPSGSSDGRRDSRPGREPSNLERQSFQVGTVCCAAILAAIACPMLFGEVYTVNDLADFHIPMRAFYARCLAAGESPAWTPDIFCGFYLHGEGQVGMYHPLHYFLYRFVSLSAAFNLEMFLNYPFMLAGMYFFLRRREIRRSACLFAAIVFTFSGFHMRHFIHVNAIAVIAHIPWLLYAIDVAARSRIRRRARLAAALVALLTASQVLLGYPQYLWFSLIAAALYVALIIPETPGKQVVWLAAAVLTGIVIGAVQILPTLDVLRDSTRPGASVGFKYFFSLGFLTLSQTVAPYLLSPEAIQSSPQEFGIYSGAAVPVLLVWLLVNLRNLGRHKRLAAGAMLMLLLSLDLAFGDRGFLGGYVAAIPVIGLFRAPVRYFTLSQLSIAVLAALAFDNACSAVEARSPVAWRKIVWLAAAVLTAVLAVWRTGWFLKSAPDAPTTLPLYAANRLLVLAGFALILVAVLLVAAAARGARFAPAAIMLFTALDLAFYGLMYWWSGPVQTIQSLAASASALPASGEYRVASASTASDLWLLNGNRLLYGYAALSPEKRLDYSDDTALRVAGAALLCKGDCISPQSAAQYEWEQVPDPLPRARLLTKCIVGPKDGGISLWGIDVDSTAVTDRHVDLPEGPPGQASVIRDRPGHIRISTAAQSRQVLVISESFHPGWRVSIDGARGEVLRIYGDFTGCVVEAGAHTADFTFAPESLRRGKIASLCALVVLVLVFVVPPFFPERMSKPAPPETSGGALA